MPCIFVDSLGDLLICTIYEMSAMHRRSCMCLLQRRTSKMLRPGLLMLWFYVNESQPINNDAPFHCGVAYCICATFVWITVPNRGRHIERESPWTVCPRAGGVLLQIYIYIYVEEMHKSGRFVGAVGTFRLPWLNIEYRSHTPLYSLYSLFMRLLQSYQILKINRQLI